MAVAGALSLYSHRFAQKPFFHSIGGKLLPCSPGRRRCSTIGMALETGKPSSLFKVVDAHLHVWASAEEAAERYPYFPGQEPSLPGDSELLLKCMGEAGVDGALIVQPINHMFDHDLVTSTLQKHPSKFIGCCLANPADDGSGIFQFEHLVLKEGYRAVRFNPNIWPSGQKITNEIGKALFSKAGELGVPVGFMCSKGISLYLSEIEELCSNFPSTSVILDHMGFCKPPINDEERKAFSELLSLSKFPQVYLKFSALFRLSRKPFPYDDTGELLSQAISSYGSNRIMWGSDFPFVVPECGYKKAKEAVSLIANQVALSSSELEWIMGRTAAQLFQHSWTWRDARIEDLDCGFSGESHFEFDYEI